jgi:NHLM bacteriocin system ABC transporter peptidase/ATP-binding protein
MKTVVKKPITRGYCDVPVIMQMEALECGAACLAMILAYYGKWMALEQVRRDSGVSRDGANAKNILGAARKYGLEAHGYRISPEAIRREATFPCIIHWNYNHFVVLTGFRAGKACLNDPSVGTISIPISEFNESYTGVALMFKPSESFEPGGRQKSIIDYASKRLSGARWAVLFTLVVSALTYAFTIINPKMSQRFMDQFLGKKDDPTSVYIFLGILVALAFLQVVIQWVAAIHVLKINGKLAINGSTSFMWKILRLPIDFFNQRMSGDILMRHSTNESIARVIVDTLSPLVLNSVMMIFYLVVMIRYSVRLTILGITATIINLFFSRIISVRRINIARGLMIDKGKLETATISGIGMIETIKASGAENGYFEEWIGLKAKADEKENRFLMSDSLWGIIPAYVMSLTNYAVLIMGVFLILRGHFTIGMITAFQQILQSFITPAQTLTRAGQSLMEMRTEMERVEDVMNYPEAIPETAPERSEDQVYEKLMGDVVLKNVTFGYSPLDEPVIRNFSMEVKQGKRVAIVGESGCGKSTVAKLISGLYKPWEGEISFDGRKIDEIDREVFTGSVAVVDQDITLFADTIENNIKMWDDSIESFEIILAARDAQIHDEILQKPGGYQHILSENGKDMSGGQRQRLEIARVLAMDPSIIILDEATSALDAQTELDVVNAIKDRGITLIVIAHRLSTIRDCDEIIVINKGEIVERGTHSQLLEADGYYKALVTND